MHTLRLISRELLGVRGRPERCRGGPLGGHETGHGKYVCVLSLEPGSKDGLAIITLPGTKMD